MLTRQEIFEMRTAAEGNGFFVEDVCGDGIIVSHLQDSTEKQYFIPAGEKCPDCDSYLLLDEKAKQYVCLNKECLYNNCLQTPPEIISEVFEGPMKMLGMKFRFREADEMYANSFMQQVEELARNWFRDLVEIEFYEDHAFNESTLGFIDDEE